MMIAKDMEALDKAWNTPHDRLADALEEMTRVKAFLTRAWKKGLVETIADLIITNTSPDEFGIYKRDIDDEPDEDFAVVSVLESALYLAHVRSLFRKDPELGHKVLDFIATGTEIKHSYGTGKNKEEYVRHLVKSPTSSDHYFETDLQRQEWLKKAKESFFLPERKPWPEEM
jgi:hypothetical protein